MGSLNVVAHMVLLQGEMPNTTGMAQSKLRLWALSIRQ